MSDRESAYDYPSTADPDGGGWLLSYADLITLLITFFIVLLSVSTIQRNRFDLLKSTFTPERTSNDLTALKKQLDGYIQAAGISDTVSTQLNMEGLNIVFQNTVLFESGAADVTAAGRIILDKVTEELVRIDKAYSLVIEGYTDDVPIRTPQFRSNWELSSGRAIGVLGALTSAGFDPKRTSIQGFADTRPTTPPLREDGTPQMPVEAWRSLNRRVVIRVY